MRQITTKAIILRRTNYGEADRIVSFLTPTQGKISALVKGVRKARSKLAGGVELFSESTVSFMQTKGNLDRIVQARIETHWGNLVGNLPRMMFAYDVMKTVNSIVPDGEGEEYYGLLKRSLAYINLLEVDLQAVRIWFWLNFLSQSGRKPNLSSDGAGNKLSETKSYEFLLSDMMFVSSQHGEFSAEHIKLLRLGLERSPVILQNIKQFSKLSEPLARLCEQMARYQLHLK